MMILKGVILKLRTFDSSVKRSTAALPSMYKQDREKVMFLSCNITSLSSSSRESNRLAPSLFRGISALRNIVTSAGA